MLVWPNKCSAFGNTIFKWFLVNFYLFLMHSHSIYIWCFNVVRREHAMSEVVFCVLEITLKTESQNEYYWHLLLFYFLKSKRSTETYREICAVYGEDAVTGWNMPEVVFKILIEKYFGSRHTSCLGRATEINNDNDPRYTIRVNLDIQCWKTICVKSIKSAISIFRSQRISICYSLLKGKENNPL